MRNNKMLAMVSRIKKFFELRFPALALSMALAATLNVAFAKINVGSDEVAIHGYDVVAYFLEGRAAQGTTEFEHSWGDANWRFSSEANKNLFVANPEQYAPQYGGFCAVCLALDGELADANPKAWTIVDGKLYLNYSMHQRTQWRIRSAAYVKLGDEAWTEVMTRESRPAKSEALFQIAVMSPLPGPDTRGLNVGSDIYESILQQPSFSIAFADEPYDPSALSFLNRGGDWPYPSTRIEASAAWEVFLGRAKNKPKFERMFDAGRDLGVDAILMWDYSWGFEQRSYPVRVYLIDVDKRHVYEHEGTTMRPEEPVRRAFDDFLAGREGYRIAILHVGFINKGKPFLVSTAADADTYLGVSGDVYRAIQAESSISISFADEPPDSSARAELNRGGDWPFPATNVDRNEAWDWDPEQQYLTPDPERIYQAGRELGVDAVAMFYLKPIWRVPQWPLEVYVFDIERQRAYVHKGENTEASALVRQAFDEFRAGRGG